MRVKLPVDVCDAVTESGGYDGDKVAVRFWHIPHWEVIVKPGQILLLIDQNSLDELRATGKITCGEYEFHRFD